MDPTITLNGVTVTFPLTYAEFAAQGFSVEAEDQEYVLNQDEYDDVTFYDANGAEVRRGLYWKRDRGSACDEGFYGIRSLH